MRISKRDGSAAKFDRNKIVRAIVKAGGISERAAESIAEEIEQSDVRTVADIESYVTDALIDRGHRTTALSYEGYRRVREHQREITNSTDGTIKELLAGASEYWNTENSNKDVKIVSTQRDYLAGITSEDISRRFLLTPEVIHAHDEGIIHFHDIDYFAQKALPNCDLINLEDMLQNGTVVNGTAIDKPRRFLTAMTIATQIITAVASSQYGGTTITLTHLAPFVRSSYEYYIDKYRRRGFSEEICRKFADEDIRKEVEDGVQTMQYQVNTMSTTNGQAPFLSVFMYLGETDEYKDELAMIIEEVLKQRLKGIKNESGVYVTPAFPKLLYTLEDDNIREDSKYWYLTELAAKCTAKRLVPDYMSEKKMKALKDGNMYPVMGCVDGEEIVTYRYAGALYVESLERMWDRFSEDFDVKEQLAEGNYYIDLKDVQIFDTEKGFVDTSRIIKNKDKGDWVRVKLSNGRSLLATEDHPLPVTDKGRTLVGELRVGDGVRINQTQYSEEGRCFDTDKAWLLGFLLGDGCYDRQLSATIAATGEDDIEENYRRVFKEHYDLDVETIVWERGKRGNYKELKVRTGDHYTVQKELLETFGGLQKRYRQIPNEVFSWERESKLSFLAGLIDADGYINSTGSNGSVIQLGSTNKELALQTAALARALGMTTRVYLNHYTSTDRDKIRYRVEFSATIEVLNYMTCGKKIDCFAREANFSESSEAFVTEIDFLGKRGEPSYDVTTESDHFEVSGIYSHNCRSALTVYYDENDKPKFYGRFNQGVVTLNLVDVALSSQGDPDAFWTLMDERSELCRRALQLRHKRLKGTPSDAAPILWQHGAIARLGKGESIDKLLYGGYSTISLGYAGLYECVKYMTDQSHTEAGGKAFALEVMTFLNDKCAEWRAAENIDYSLYGSPIESATYKFAKCLRRRFGEVEGITDKKYITNSYHVPVFEEIDAFTKLAKESEFQELSPGGAISYVEIPNMNHNIPVILEAVKFIYDNIMYAELNTKSDYCVACGYDGELLIDDGLDWYCPNCGNRDTDQMSVARRTCGYIGTNLWNKGRTQEIKERVLHIDNFDYIEEVGGGNAVRED